MTSQFSVNNEYLQSSLFLKNFAIMQDFLLVCHMKLKQDKSRFLPHVSAI